MDLKQGVREAKVTCKKTAFATLGGGDSPILNPSPVLELVVGWLEEELGQLALLWRLPADWVEDEAGQLA